MISEEKIKKIKEMKKQGKSNVEIGLEMGITPALIREITKKTGGSVNKDGEIMENTKVKFIIMKLQISQKDYFYFQKIKQELSKKNGEISDEFVLYKLLEIYQKFAEYEEENKKLKEILKRVMNKK
jgi:hypothetical protein